MSLDLSNDWKLVDDPVTVTLFSKLTEGTYDAGTSVPYAQKGPVTKEDVTTDPELLQKDSAVFHLWAAKLSGKVPKIADRITFSSANWKSKRVEMLDRDANGIQRYRLTCTKEVT